MGGGGARAQPEANNPSGNLAAEPAGQPRW